MEYDTLVLPEVDVIRPLHPRGGVRIGEASHPGPGEGDSANESANGDFRTLVCPVCEKGFESENFVRCDNPDGGCLRLCHPHCVDECIHIPPENFTRISNVDSDSLSIVDLTNIEDSDALSIIDLTDVEESDARSIVDLTHVEESDVLSVVNLTNDDSLLHDGTNAIPMIDLTASDESAPLQTPAIVISMSMV